MTLRELPIVDAPFAGVNEHASSVVAHDAVHLRILRTAGPLGDGIIRQPPGRVGR